MADTAHLLEHVKDSTSFHLPGGWVIEIPQPLEIAHWIGIEDPPQWLGQVQLTKFMLIELVAAILMLVIFIPLARRIVRGEPPQGRFWNFFEVILVFLRDEVARPAIGKHDADRFLPYIWSIFFFILFCNLLGLVPWLGSPTGAFACTTALAILAYVICIGAGVKQFGPLGYFTGQVPKMGLSWPLAIFLWPMILIIEVGGLLIKHFVLSVRLMSNMFAGHLVLAVIVGFIAQTAGLVVWWGVMPASVLGALAISLLELFVAFLQAYIFAFLSALFIGMAVHQH